MKRNEKRKEKIYVSNRKQEKTTEQAAEQAAEKQAMYVEFWESMTENEYLKNVQMINTNQFDILSPLFQDDELLEFFKMKKKQADEQSNQDSKTFFELLPNMHESVQMSMIEFINDHYTDEQTHVDYMSLVKMAREKAVHEHEEFELHNQNNKLEQKKFDDFWFAIHQPDKMKNLEVLENAIKNDNVISDENVVNYIVNNVGLSWNDFLTMWEVKQAQQAQLRENLLKFAEGKAEQAEHEETAEQENEEQEKFLSFWKSLNEQKKELCITGMQSGYIAGFARKFVIENFKSENNFNMLLQNQIFIEKHLIVVSEEEQAELERLEKIGDLIEENLRNEELEEEETDRLEKEFFAGYAQETEVEEVATEVQNEILTQNPTITMKTQEIVNEVATENTTVNNTQNIVNQQVTNNTLNVTVETPKPKMTIAEKIVEVHKMLTIADKKETMEIRLKEFYGYLHANRDGDNFRLMSSDEKYKFYTNNAELVKEVNVVLERFFKTKIQEFETELTNFQI